MRTVWSLVAVGISGPLALTGFEISDVSAQYAPTNLSSNVPGLANFTDPNLTNPWGLSFSPTSPFWSANQKSGTATLHFGDGSQAPTGSPLIVTVPTSGPTGTVFNPTSANFSGDRFLFSTLGGQIEGWSGGTTAAIRVDNSPTGAVYTGLALSGGNIYAANFHSGTIDVFDGTGLNYTQITLPGNFTDPNLPAGFAPFNVQTLNAQLFVTYAKQGLNDQPDFGPGLGFVDIFNLSTGALIQRLISQGPLDAPWGLALAPSNFGQFSNDLLVGNHGDGSIWAFDPITGLVIDQLKDADGNPIINPGLWALAFGNGGQGFNPDALYFTAGINGGIDGLFGEIQATPLPAALPLFATGLGSLGLFGWRRKRKAAALAA